MVTTKFHGHLDSNSCLTYGSSGPLLINLYIMKHGGQGAV